MLDFNNLPAKDKIYYQDESAVIYCADNREILPLFPDKAFRTTSGLCGYCKASNLRVYFLSRRATGYAE